MLVTFLLAPDGDALQLRGRISVMFDLTDMAAATASAFV